MASSVFTAFAAAMVLYCSFVILDVPPNLILLCATFLVIYSVYSLNRLTDQEEDAINMPTRSAFVQGNERLLLILAAASYIAALVLGWVESPLAAGILFVPFLSGIIYSTDALSTIGIPRLKDIFLVKSLIVAFSLTVCAAFLPALYLYGDFVKLWFVFPFIFIKIFINTVLFDVRDVDGDTLSGVKTIPVVIGITRTRQALLILQSLLVLWLMLFLDIFSEYYIILIISIIYGYFYILYFCDEKEHSGVSWDVLLDGEWVLMSILIWIYFSIHTYLNVIA